MPTFIGRSFTAEKTISWFLFGTPARWQSLLVAMMGEPIPVGYCGDIE